ncbi:MAG: RsmD family RNA methyltransferase [Propionibacteriaceae bacterium]|jgi:16S rRNA (guanine966-N2)-methyltransferase|nr:RsmD family RNA methyltransferase [Propionibacteriaceae bacterium]
MIRIVAGRWASRRLAAPAGDRVRPTSDRVREAVFAHLAARLGRGGAAPEDQLTGLTFLDLFAGGGGVGYEAASRGAASVTWVERDRAAAGLIERQRRLLGATGRVVSTAVETFLECPGRHDGARPGFDLVWLDPPYDLPAAELERLIDLVWEHGWLALDGLILVERSKRSPTPRLERHFPDHWWRDYGDTRVYLGRGRPTT